MFILKSIRRYANSNHIRTDARTLYSNCVTIVIVFSLSDESDEANYIPLDPMTDRQQVREVTAYSLVSNSLE